ncbi:MAG: hypothetical protein IKS79_01565 [Bacteroidales bacterium]|nr:hypothetical protein [Bacteroidales bacterium]
MLEKYGYYFSVETPTKDKYSFSNKNQGKKECESGKGRSANFDLTIKGQDGKTNIAIIEFKANSASDHECAKDICKLWNDKEEGSFRYFLNLFRTMDKETHDTLIRKLSPGKNKFLLSPKNKIKVHVIAQSSSKSEKEYYYDGSV